MEASRSHEEASITSEVTPIPIEKARFIDQLEPKYEHLWQSVVQVARETPHHSNEGLMVPIWANDSCPQVFRDRAMLTVVGDKDTRRQLGLASYGTNLGIFSPMTVSALESVPEFRPSEFASWLQETLDHQQSSETIYIHESRIFNWAIELYNAQELTTEEFEALLDNIETAEARPLFEDYVDGGTWGSGVATVNPSDNFPVLADVLNSQTYMPANARLKYWALEQLSKWLAAQKGKDIQLPAWLAEATEEQGLQLFQQLAKQCQRETTPYLDWDTIRPGIKRYGINVVCPRGPELNDIKDISDKEIRQQAAHYILRLRLEQRGSGREIQPYSQGQLNFFVSNINDQDRLIRDMLKYEQKLHDEEEAERQARVTKEKAEREEKRRNDPDTIATKKALKHFHSLLAGMQAIEIETIP